VLTEDHCRFWKERHEQSTLESEKAFLQQCSAFLDYILAESSEEESSEEEESDD
jgi:hypothetical protein